MSLPTEESRLLNTGKSDDTPPIMTMNHHGSATQDNEELLELEKRWFDENAQRFEGKPWYKKPSKAVLYAVLSLHTLSFAILMGPVVELMLQSVCSAPEASHSANSTSSNATGPQTQHSIQMFKRMDMGGSPADCQNTHSQQTLSNIQSALAIISGILGFFLAGKYGQLSDIHGRVYVFKIFSCINVVYILVLIMYFELYPSHNPFLMVVAVSFGFLNGGIMTLIANGNAYLHDVVHATSRTSSISVLMAFIYSMVGFGPLVGSFAIKWADGRTEVALYIALSFAILSLLAIFILLVEPRHPEAQALARTKHTAHHNHSGSSAFTRGKNSIMAFFHPIKRLWLDGTHSPTSRRNVVVLVLIDVLVMASTVGTMHTVAQYTIMHFKWTSVELGYYMSITGFGKSFVLLVLGPVLLRFLMGGLSQATNTRALDMVDYTLVGGSMVFVFLSSVVIVLWDSSYGVYASAILQSLAGLISPTIQSTVVKYSSSTTAGEMFGAMALVRHLAMLVVPVLFLQVYRATVESWSWGFLALAMCFATVGLWLSAVGLKVDEKHDEAALLDDYDDTSA